MGHHFEIINQALLSEMSSQAEKISRLRKNYNFHLDNNDTCHRLLNAIQPGSYVVPHCHLSPDKDETIIVLSGCLGVIIFDNTGGIKETIKLSLLSNNKGINLIHGCFHTVLALEPNTVFFESKAGPYQALTTEEIAYWAPKENTPEAENYYKQLLSYF